MMGKEMRTVRSAMPPMLIALFTLTMITNLVPITGIFAPVIWAVIEIIRVFLVVGTFVGCTLLVLEPTEIWNHDPVRPITPPTLKRELDAPGILHGIAHGTGAGVAASEKMPRSS